MIASRTLRNVLVVAGTSKSVDFITEALDPSEFYPVTYARNGSEARRRLINADFDLTIINAPLPDEEGDDLALFTAERLHCGVLILVRSEIYDETCQKVENFGVLTIAKPVSRQSFHQALRLTVAASRRMELYEEENIRLHSKIEELRIVARAKCVLIEYLKMSESQAHRYIEKQAMDMRATKKEIAEEILKTYEP